MADAWEWLELAVRDDGKIETESAAFVVVGHAAGRVHGEAVLVVVREHVATDLMMVAPEALAWLFWRPWRVMEPTRG